MKLKIVTVFILMLTSVSSFAQKKAEYPDGMLLQLLLSQAIKHTGNGFTDWRGNETTTPAGKHYETLFRLTTGDEPEIFEQNATYFYADKLLSGGDNATAERTRDTWLQLITEAFPSWKARAKKIYGNVTVTGFTTDDASPFAIRLISYTENEKQSMSIVVSKAESSDESAIGLLVPFTGSAVSDEKNDAINKADVFSDLFGGTNTEEKDPAAISLRNMLEYVYLRRGENLMSIRGKLIDEGVIFKRYQSTLKVAEGTTNNYIEYGESSFSGSTITYYLPIEKNVSAETANDVMFKWKKLISEAYPEEWKHLDEEIDDADNLKIIISKDLKLDSKLNISEGWMLILEMTGKGQKREVLMRFKVK